MPFQDLGLLVFSPPAADRGQEVGKVVLTLPFKCADQLAAGIEQRAARDDALGPFKDRRTLIAERLRLQAPRLGNDRLVAEIENADLRVGRLAGVAVAQPPAVADHRPPQARVEQDSRAIDRMPVTRHRTALEAGADRGDDRQLLVSARAALAEPCSGGGSCLVNAGLSRDGPEDRTLEPAQSLWHNAAEGVQPCCRSSVVEHSLGKGEVDSSILSGSTIGYCRIRLKSKQSPGPHRGRINRPLIILAQSVVSPHSRGNQ